MQSRNFTYQPIPQPPHPSFLCCKASLLYLIMLNSFNPQLLPLQCPSLCSKILLNLQNPDQTLPSFIPTPLPTLMVLGTSTTLCSPARSHLTIIACIFIHLPIGLWVLGQGWCLILCLYPHHAAQCLPVLKMLKKLCTHIWKCEYMKVVLNWKMSFKCSN